ncbi:Cytochrome b561/ferric reductase transmembrane [Tolypocladium paradoxum]|uniref:Cytochrome b561/ferric reductase transmembrane n=1 Tax=Tolypocladium paradoxum TaxID=94208 RepID=A0A2S4L644_9HYPO|nr:Cytochrome b561/ferric reductase transmembrane [Tolypocladium paradoxum]
MAPTPDELSAPGAVSYDSSTMSVGDGTWDFSKNSFLLPNLQGLNFDTMQYNGMANRFSTLTQYHRIVLAHGVMAALIFLLLVPGSVMLVRFYSRQPGYAVVYHAQLQVLAGLMLLAVFILGYFAVGPERSLSNPHHGIGVAIFLLFILQLVGGRLVRHITKIRSLRIMIHQWSGRAIALLGIVQVPLGLTLYGSPKYLFVLYALWMAFLVLVYFILSYRSEGRREFYMRGARSETGRTRVTESEFFSTDPKPHDGGWTKWLGPLAAGAGIWALLRRKNDRDRVRSRSRSRSRSHSRSREPEVIPSRRGSDSRLTEKYSELAPQKTGGGGGGGGGGMMKVLGGAAAAIGAGKLVSGFMDRRQSRRDEEYSAVSTETPRRHRSGRGAPTMSEFSSDLTDNYRRDARDGTNTSLWPPSANPAAMAQARGAAESRDPRRPTTPRPMHARGEVKESDYSSYVSPSRRPVEDRPSGSGFAKGILSGLGMGWFAKKMADRRAKKEDDRLRDEEDMRSGTQVSRFTGDGYPSPSRRNFRRPPVRQPTGFARNTDMSEVTGSSLETRPAAGTYGAPMPPSQPGAVPPITPVPMPGGHSRSRSRSKHDPVSMPAMPPDPRGILHEAEGSFVSSGDSRVPQRRTSSRRRKAGDRAASAAAARAGSLAASQDHVHRDDRDRYGSPSSQPVSVKLKVHDDRDRNVTLRRLTEEEAMAARGPRSRGDSESSLSGLDSPSYGRRYRRESSQQRAERAAERAAERGTGEDQLTPLSPPNPAFAKGGRRAKDSAYYSGQPGPSGTAAPIAGQTVSSLGSPESHGTWSAMSMSPSGPDRGPEAAGADDRRRRRRQERRTAASSTTRPSGVDMFD